jgi:trehalose 6-phosphate synthase/phosphatase
VLAIGDDRTDEDLFGALPPEAVSIRVGPGQTRARFRLDGVPAVRALLQSLVEAGAGVAGGPSRSAR